MFRRDCGNCWWTLKCYFSKNRLLGCNINTLSLTHLSLQHYPSGLLSCYRRQSLIKEHFCASLISHNEFTRGADLSFFPPFSTFLFLQSLTATKQRSRSSVWPSFHSLCLRCGTDSLIRSSAEAGHSIFLSVCLAADWAHVSGCVKWARMAFVSPLWNPYLILLKGEQRQHTHTLSPFPIAAISCFYQQLTQRTFDTTTILQTKQVTIQTTNTQYFPHRSRVAVQGLVLHLYIYTFSGLINIYAFTQFRKFVHHVHLCCQLESDRLINKLN